MFVNIVIPQFIEKLLDKYDGLFHALFLYTATTHENPIPRTAFVTELIFIDTFKMKGFAAKPGLVKYLRFVSDFII